MDAAERSPSSPDQGRSISTGPPRLTPLREQQLVQAYQSGDPAALSELLGAYQRRIYGVCRRMLPNHEDASDLTQESLIRMMDGLSSYDGRARLSTWAIRVAMNCCLSHLRKEKLRRHAPLDDQDGEGGWNPGDPREHEAAARVEHSETRKVLEEALLDLEPSMRAILILRDLQELEYQQVAEVLDVPVGTVKSRLFRARTALREALERRRG